MSVYLLQQQINRSARAHPLRIIRAGAPRKTLRLIVHDSVRSA